MIFSHCLCFSVFDWSNGINWLQHNKKSKFDCMFMSRLVNCNVSITGKLVFKSDW